MLYDLSAYCYDRAFLAAFTAEGGLEIDLILKPFVANVIHKSGIKLLRSAKEAARSETNTDVQLILL